MNDIIISIKRSPLLLALLPFIIGISIAQSELISNVSWLVSWTILGTIALIIFRKLKLSTNYLWGVLVITVLITVGFIHFNLYQVNHTVQLQKSFNYQVKAICLDSPEQTQYGYKCEMRVTHLGNDKLEKTRPFKVIVFMEQDDSVDSLKTGSSILAVMRFNEIRNRGNPHEFDYQYFQYLNNINYAGRILQQQWVLLQENRLPIRRFAEKCRGFFDESINMTLFSEREKSILTAMCLGDKSNMTERTMTLFQRMGIAHLFAVSGLHVGFVFLLFQSIFRRMASYSKLAKVLSTIVPVIGIWFFTLITGLPESAIRASIMFSIIALGNLSSKKHFSVNNLALAAFVILTINPKQLFQIGFQLSFLAVLGILLLYNKINRSVYVKNYLGHKIWELVSISISAQFLIFPLLLYHFHQFSFAFVFSNIIATPVSALLLYGGLLLNIFSFIPFFQNIIAYLVKFVFSFFLVSLDALENISWFFADNIYLTQWEFIVLILMAFSSVLLIYFFHIRWIYFFLSLTLAFAIINLEKKFQRTTHKSLTVYNVPRSSTLSFVSDQLNILLTDTTILHYPKREDYYLGGHYLSTGTYDKVLPLNINSSVRYKSKSIDINARQNNYWIRFENRTIMILESPISLKESYPVDILIIRNYRKRSIKPFLTNIDAGIVVFDNTAAFYHIDNWKAECMERDQHYHYTKESGAYELHL